VWSKRDGKKVYKTFASMSAAKEWRSDATTSVRPGALRATASPTLQTAAEAWLEAAERGAEAGKLLAALPDDDRALWATAFYAGLRLGELRALRVRNVNVDADVIHVEHGWDVKAGEIEPKSKAGIREIPVPEILKATLVAHLEQTRRSEGDLSSGERRAHHSRTATCGSARGPRGLRLAANATGCHRPLKTTGIRLAGGATGAPVARSERTEHRGRGRHRLRRGRRPTLARKYGWGE
jgi:integrase